MCCPPSRFPIDQATPHATHVCVRESVLSSFLLGIRCDLNTSTEIFWVPEVESYAANWIDCFRLGEGGVVVRVLCVDVPLVGVVAVLMYRTMSKCILREKII